MSDERRTRVTREEDDPTEVEDQDTSVDDEDHGLSLEELSETYAALVHGGDDPYEEAPEKKPPTADESTLQEEVEEIIEELEENETDTNCEISPRSILEAMLFIGHPENEPLTPKIVASLMRGVRSSEISGLVTELNQEYEELELPCFIDSVGKGYKMVLSKEFEFIRNRFYGAVKEAKLSQAAVDVLSIVAYNQPVTRDEVDNVRSQPSSGLLSQLVRRNLIRIERPDEKPRIPRYYTTDRFLSFFGLESIDELPYSQDIDRG